MQRVALGRALVREPRAFLMDEPLTNLDLKLRVEMRTELTRIHRLLGRTFLYVTNDQVEAMSMADQVAVLREGTVQQVGTPTEVYDRPANRWVATFVGSPRMNLLPCTANGRLTGPTWSLPNPGFDVIGDHRAVLGVRSEDLSLDARNESESVPGVVYAVEPLGDRTMIDVEIGEQRVMVKALPSARLAIGEQVRVGVDLHRIHLFDADSEAAILAPMTVRVLPPELRRADILERVQRDGRVSLADLANDYAVSPVTVHRDLDLLSSGGLIERVRGGARAVPKSRAPIETAWSARLRQAGPQKDAIARQARATDRRRVGDLPRRLDDRAGPGPSARTQTAPGTHGGDELAGDRAGHHRRVGARHRHSRGAGPADAGADRTLDG